MGTSRGAEMGTSRGAQKELQEVPNREPLIIKTNRNNNKINNTIFNNTKSNHISKNDRTRIEITKQMEIDAYEEIIKDNIEYDALITRHPTEKDRINEIVELMLKTVICESDKILIASQEYPKELVKSKFLKLDMDHIEYVLDCMGDNTKDIRNIKKYILATLFNSFSTMNNYYRSKVNYDMFGDKEKIEKESGRFNYYDLSN